VVIDLVVGKSMSLAEELKLKKLKLNPSFNINSESMREKFMKNIKSNNIDIIECMLRNGFNPNYEPNAVGYSVGIGEYLLTPPLLVAAACCAPIGARLRIMNILLEYGADPNYLNDCEGYTGTALHWSIYESRDWAPLVEQHLAAESLILLLENGANPFVRDEDEKTPYDICIDEDEEIHPGNTLILKKFMDIIRIQRCYRHKMTRKRVKTIKSERRLALMKCMEFREGPLDTIRYDPSILERISKFI